LHAQRGCDRPRAYYAYSAAALFGFSLQAYRCVLPALLGFTSPAGRCPYHSATAVLADVCTTSALRRVSENALGCRLRSHVCWGPCWYGLPGAMWMLPVSHGVTLVASILSHTLHLLPVRTHTRSFHVFVIDVLREHFGFGLDASACL
jgi:hypothetical protein